MCDEHCHRRDRCHPEGLFPPRIVLLELGLPTMDGYQVAQLLREYPEFASVLIIAITGYGAPEDKQRAYQTGIDLHLTKPVKVNFLKELISVYGQEKSFMPPHDNTP